jgi:predicted pyridoxine 5'-phosphate oxidase superfamily flavin-nucleotide-binding protein
VNGRAVISADPDLLASFSVDGHAPRTAIVITVEEIYFQCARAIIRAKLWDPDTRVDPESLPTPGAILAALTAGAVGGARYDADWPERAAKTMW